MRRGIIVFAVFLAFLAVLPAVFAEISFEPINAVYSMGDAVNANVVLGSKVDTAGYFVASLICGVRETELYKSIEVLKADEPKTISVVALLEEGIVGSLGGECYIRGTYGSGEARSQTFKISRAVSVEVFVDSVVFKPGDQLSITGAAIKDNRAPLNGFLEVTIVGDQLNLPSVLPTEPVTSANTTEENEENSNNEDAVEENANETNIEEDNSEESSDNEVEETPEESAVQGQVLEQGGRVVIGSFTTSVVEGSFNSQFVIPKSAPSGSYQILVRAYDQDRQGRLMNEGNALASFSVEQIIQDLVLELDANSFKPDSDVNYRAVIHDQAGALAQGEVRVTILDPNKDIFIERLIPANQNTLFHLDANLTPGFWEVQAVMEELKGNKVFFVEEYKKINYRLEEGSLIVTNVGNVPYEGALELKIGETTRVVDISLQIGETNSFKLEAPDGEYLIEVSDGTDKQSLGKTFLTGNVVSVDQVKDFAFGDKGIIMWASLIFILLILITIVVVKIMKRKYASGTGFTLPAQKERTVVRAPAQVSAPMQISSLGGFGTSMRQGEREQATIIALKLKNLAGLRSAPASTNSPVEIINKLLLQARDAGSKIYVEGDYRMIIFSYSTTKQRENDLKGISIAKDMEFRLREYNRIAALKVDFGIGIHSGEMAVEIEPQIRRIRFVSLGNTLSIAKRIADYSQGTVLLSDQIYKRNLGKIKVEKVAGTDFFMVRQIVERGQYNDFLQKFMGRT